jgi:tRNA A-37 threonylcarbamoyl transferase component Bud32
MSEADPLIHHAAEAVADGLVVDWDAAAERVRSPAQKAILHSLRDIWGFAQRGDRRRKGTTEGALNRRSTFVGVLAGLATLQIAIGLFGYATGNSDQSEVPAIWQAALMLVFAAGGLGLAVGGRHDRRAVLLGAFYLIVATSFAQRFIGWLVGSPRPLWANLFLETLAPYVLWRFVQAFPHVERFSTADRRAALIASCSLVIGCALLAANLALAIAPSSSSSTLLSQFGRWRPSRNLYWAIISGLTLAALVAAPFRARSAPSSERRRVTLFLAAIAVGAAPLLIELLLEIFWQSVAAEISPSLLAAITYPLLASIPVTTAYAVLVERVVEVTFVLRKTLQYALAKVALLGLTLAPLALLVQLGIRYRHLTIGDLVQHPVGRILAAMTVLGVALLLLRERLLAGIDRAFRKRTQSLELAVAAVTSDIRDAADVRELSDRVEPIVASMLDSPRSSVLTMSADANAFIPSRHLCAPLPRESAIIALLGDEDDALDLSAEDERGVFQMLPRVDKGWLQDTCYSAVAPLRGRAGNLLGLLAVRPKTGGLRFTIADLAALRAMAGPIALVLEQFGQPTRRAASGDGNGEVLAECVECGSVLTGPVQRCRCGGSLRTAAVPDLVAGKFRVERRLGAGAMGTAYLARDLGLDRTVVIKALPRRSAATTRQLEGEARAMASVTDHRLAMIFGVETWRGAPLLVMEYLAGGTLADRLRLGPVAYPDMLQLGATLANGLQVLHDNGVLHRDIKPSNIAFTSEGSPKLLDFGLASFRDHTDGSAELAGTPLYLSPEAVQGGSPGPADDLWSLSLVLYEAIAGSNPFASDTVQGALRRVASAEIPKLRCTDAELPPVVSGVFEGLLDRHRPRRPATAKDLATRLETALAELPAVRH